MFLLIACGNSLRQDDSAGLRLAEALAAAWEAAARPIRLVIVQQLTPELALEIARPEICEVLFVDTRVARDVYDVAVETTAISPTLGSPSLGHHLSPETLMFLTQALFDARKDLIARQLTVPGFEFAHSEKLSEPCQAILNRVIQGEGAAAYARAIDCP